jgi:spore germination protein GerM
LILFGCALCIAAGIGWFLAKQSVESPHTNPVDVAIQQKAPGKERVHLYFGDLQGRYLRAEQRVMDLPEDAVRRGRLLVSSLFSGPQAGGSRTFPEKTRLRSFFITADGTAYVDLEQDPLKRHPGGVETELLSIYSIVNTLVLNVEIIRSVKLLIGGQEAATLAGHVDLRHAFKADMLWIR